MLENLVSIPIWDCKEYLLIIRTLSFWLALFLFKFSRFIIFTFRNTVPFAKLCYAFEEKNFSATIIL